MLNITRKATKYVKDHKEVKVKIVKEIFEEMNSRNIVFNNNYQSFTLVAKEGCTEFGQIIHRIRLIANLSPEECHQILDNDLREITFVDGSFSA